MAFLVNIEGIDGSGKGTQARLLSERLTAANVTHQVFSFPRYAETLFGRLAGEFLNGRFGTLQEVHPQLAALVFAGDRFESKQLLLEAIAANEVVILDRYVPSNAAHQAAKCQGEERRLLIKRIFQIEYDIYGLPWPDLSVLLDIPVATAQDLIARKSQRDYTDRAADIQEADGRYLEEVRTVYQSLAREARWHILEGLCGGEMRPMEEIAAELWQLLPAELTGKSR